MVKILHDLRRFKATLGDFRRLSVLLWIRGFHVYKGWWTPHNGESPQLQPEPENPKDRNAVSGVKDRRVVGHMPLMLVNTKESLGLIKHFLQSQGPMEFSTYVGRQSIGAED